MAGELDHGVWVTRHRLDDIDGPVDIREPPLGRVEQSAVKGVHDTEITVGPMSIDAMTVSSVLTPTSPLRAAN